jgi:hypothetical protein
MTRKYFNERRRQPGALSGLLSRSRFGGCGGNGPEAKAALFTGGRSVAPFDQLVWPARCPLRTRRQSRLLAAFGRGGRASPFRAARDDFLMDVLFGDGLLVLISISTARCE